MVTEFLKSFGLPIVAGGMGIAAFAAFVAFARNYRKCPPNKVLVVYGRKKDNKGYRLITGGSAFVLPLFESHTFIGLENFSIETSVSDTPNVDGVSVSVEATATVKVSSEPQQLANAVERMLGKEVREIHVMLKNTLEGLLRQIIGTLTVEEIIKDRERLKQQVLQNAQEELSKIGIMVDNFVINRVSDKNGYIEALGAKRTADVKRDATIAQAEADREALVKSSAAKQEGESARLAADQRIAESNRDLSLKQAAYLKETATAQAEAAMAKSLKEAEIQKDLNQRVIAAQEAETKARIALAEQEAQRVEKELVYTKIRPAEAEAQALTIRAKAASTAATITAEGNSNAAVKQAAATKAEAEANKVKLILEGEGRAAADAASKRQMGLAEAEVTKAKGEAEGVSITVKLTAEAEGLRKKNEALAQMSDGARFIILMEKLPEIIDELGEAGQKIVGAAFEQVGAGLSRIDSVHIIDMGNGGNGNGSGVAKFGMSIPEIVFGVVTKAKALGLDVDGIMEKLGVPKGALTGLLDSMNPGSFVTGSGTGPDNAKETPGS